mmetsp:Transcript_8876/g.27492  ORF Transcript_8876/g.27492 Transcript_8876/m.27492 type:complete len:505 (-) Transcript_8876:88-1602(-)|eukprot:CAMPEP_0174244696 /NCGR_PEP_ID=MMETSP0417-20130205/36230_1 /TAXON_ID=242541 /ORGANISM="Mayorella sp, Strain BSH-02190019" /LENGTH=504 /DNA_ID=CAMNT_0015324409 /DNA_START=90 /DNA_END=1604 /DNA_ORIENTATION=+
MTVDHLTRRATTPSSSLTPTSSSTFPHSLSSSPQSTTASAWRSLLSIIGARLCLGCNASSSTALRRISWFLVFLALYAIVQTVLNSTTVPVASHLQREAAQPSEPHAARRTWSSLLNPSAASPHANSIGTHPPEGKSPLHHELASLSAVDRNELRYLSVDMERQLSADRLFLRERLLAQAAPSEELPAMRLLVVWTSDDSLHQLWQSVLLGCSLQLVEQPNFVRILSLPRAVHENVLGSAVLRHQLHIDTIPTYVSERVEVGTEQPLLYAPFRHILELSEFIKRLRLDPELSHIEYVALVDSASLSVQLLERVPLSNRPLANAHIPFSRNIRAVLGSMIKDSLNECLLAGYSECKLAGLWFPQVIALQHLERVLPLWPQKVREVQFAWLGANMKPAETTEGLSMSYVWGFLLVSLELGIVPEQAELGKYVGEVMETTGSSYPFLLYWDHIGSGSWTWAIDMFENQFPSPIILPSLEGITHSVLSFVNTFNLITGSCPEYLEHLL